MERTIEQNQQEVNGFEKVLSTIIDVKTLFPSVYYILYLTDRRIIGVRKGVFSSASEAGGAIGGILGAVIGAGIDKTLKNVIRASKKHKRAHCKVNNCSG